MKRNRSTSKRAAAALCFILASPGFSSAQSYTAAGEAAEGASVAAGAAPAAVAPASIGPISAPVAPASFSAPINGISAPAAAPWFQKSARARAAAAARVAASAEVPAAAPAEVSAEAAAMVPVAKTQVGASAEDSAAPEAAPEALSAENKAPNATTVSPASSPTQTAAAAVANAAGTSRRRGFFDGFFSRGRKIDGNALAGVAAYGTRNAAPSGLKPATSARASARAGLWVPSPRVRTAASVVGVVVALPAAHQRQPQRRGHATLLVVGEG